jgi:hypothetical protein
MKKLQWNRSILQSPELLQLKPKSLSQSRWTK